MLDGFEIWKFVAGLGIFLFGMFQLEYSLKVLAGRSFKLFLRKHTGTAIKAVLVGMLITAVLQSSSVVSLMVLAFVGAGIIKMKHGLAIVFGSNLGTTFTAWVVATIGFKLNIEGFALPAIGIGSVLMLAFSNGKILYNSSRFLVGFGFLFLGLDYMKVSIENFAEGIDIAEFANYGLLVFSLIGVGLTALIQSSSAMLVITLSVLNAGLISFESAAAMVIGANIGSTSTILLGSIKGIPEKKRIALGQLLFNVTTGVVAFILIGLASKYITNILNITDQLIALAVYHSLFNLMGIVIFLPFIGKFSKFLKSKFAEADDELMSYMKKDTTKEPMAAIHVMEREGREVIEETIKLNLIAFHVDENEEDESFTEKMKETLGVGQKSFGQQYDELKQREGEVVEFYVEVQNQEMETPESARLNQLIACVRGALHSAKSLKNVHHNLEEFNNSANDFLHGQYVFFKEQSQEFYDELRQLLNTGNEETNFEKLADMMRLNQKQYEQFLKQFYKKKEKLAEIEISTVLNVNREIYSSHKNIVRAAKNLLLSPERSEDFNDIPDYIHGMY